MSVYIGLIVSQVITNKNRFMEVINEVKHFIQAYENDLIIEYSINYLQIWLKN